MGAGNLDALDNLAVEDYADSIAREMRMMPAVRRSLDLRNSFQRWSCSRPSALVVREDVPIAVESTERSGRDVRSRENDARSQRYGQERRQA
jgi:hypothetical protein